MKFIKAGMKASTFTLAGIRLSAITEKSEEELEKLIKELKSSKTFKLLHASGVIRFSGFKGIHFATKDFDECRLRSDSGPNFSTLLNGKSEFICRIRNIGQKNFEKYFLKSECSDIEISEECGMTLEEIKKMKEFVNEFFIYSDLNCDSLYHIPQAISVYSSVAGVEIKRGVPTLAFFHRDVWKERFLVDNKRLKEYLKILGKGEDGKIRNILESLSLIENRKSTLYSLLELLIKEQRKYFLTGNPQNMKVLKQKDVANMLNVHPSVLSRIISNKSIQMPWGVEVPLAQILPSEKDINKERLALLLNDSPDLPDREMCEKMSRIYGVKLSRRSISQYRKEILGKNSERKNRRSI